MTETSSNQRIQVISRRLSAIDIAVGVCTTLYALSLTWILEPRGVAFTGTAFTLATAAVFFVAAAALRHDWRGRWPLQLIGPAVTLYLLFGLPFAVAGSILIALTGSLVLWWASRQDH